MPPQDRGRAPDATKAERDAALQRVRVGVTGLAAVFLLTLLAAAMLSLFGQDNRARERAAAVLAAQAPREPLAELGVAPGAPQKQPAAVPPRPAPRVPPSTH